MGSWQKACLFRGFAAALVDAIEDCAHILDLLEEGGRDENGFLLRGGDGEAVAGARIHLDNFPGRLQFILLLQDQPGEVSGVFQVSDDNPFDVDAEALKNAVDQIVGEGPFLRRLPQEHPDDGAHLGFDVDDKDFLVIADKQRATAGGGKYSANLHGNHVVLHATNLICAVRKTSWITREAVEREPRHAWRAFPGWPQSRLARNCLRILQ